MVTLHFAHALLVTLAVVTADPRPGRIPKVYNALITSNQNLVPSKAINFVQPVQPLPYLHDSFFPYQPVYYPTNNFPSILPVPKNSAQAPVAPPSQPAPSVSPAPETPEVPPESSSEDNPEAKQSETTAPPQEHETSKAASEDSNTSLIPPSTESPIPLNEFGLPPQVLPLGRINPAYEGFNQVGPFTYSYPGLRFYDPYFSYNFSPYANFPPLYSPLNSLGQVPTLNQRPTFNQGGNFIQEPIFRPEVLSQDPLLYQSPPKEAPQARAPEESSPPQQGNPPPEPANLEYLNFSTKDPNIPNVPPPPLP